MDKLKDIIETRDKRFKKTTNEIFSELTTPLECIQLFLESIEPSLELGYFLWADVFLEDGLVILLGYIKFKPNTMIENEGISFEVTEDNVEDFTRPVHMAIPYDLLIHGSNEDIINFLTYMQRDENDEYVEQGAEFNLAELSDEQKASLAMFNSWKG